MFGNDWFEMFSNMMGGTLDFDKMIDEYIKNAEIGMLNGVKTRIDGHIEKLKKPKESPFTVLGLKQDCTEEEFKAAYRKRTKETHPDTGGTAEDFKKVQAAYEAIKRFKGWS
jgi:DnaJ-class molecular chaperone